MLSKLEETHNMPVDSLFKVRGLRDLHTALHTKMFKHQSLEDFLTTMKINDSDIENIKIPILCLHAKDDPIARHDIIPFSKIKQNSKIIFAETNHGSHICWFEGLIPKRWYPKPTLEFLENHLNLKSQKIDQDLKDIKLSP
mmetsp:Transcript_33414/g.30407  ORF Transcript_33414/g.30407 Transcript_33414/m.30407 type:complete len:141 (+) Transcript_33414:874-1296(+)